MIRSAPWMILAACLALPISVAGQRAGALPRVLELPASTRAQALGDAYMMNARHAEAIFYHPALLRGASGFGMDIQRWDTKSSATAISAAMSWLGGSVGVGLQTLQYGAPDAATASPAGQDDLFTLGPLPVSERVASVGYARELFGIDVGLVTKFVEERVGGSRDATVLWDAGVASDVGPVKVGLSYQNVGQDLTILGADVDRPDRLTLGAGAYGKQLGPLDVGLTAAVSRVGGETIPAGGLEVGYWPIRGRTFVGRVGVRRVPHGDANPLSVGAAYWGDNLVLEWAYQPFDGELSGTHRFGVRWR
jgi:hypothetical protein